jgi:hypothetical protein
MPKPPVPGGRTDLLHLDQPTSGDGCGDDGCGCGGGGGGGGCGGHGRGRRCQDAATTEGTEATPTATDA